MKLLLIVDDYLPDSIKIAAKMMHQLGCEFLRQGHEVTVVTPKIDLKSSSEICTLDGVQVCRFKSGKIKNVNKITRALNETMLSRRAWKSLKHFFINNPHDAVIYYSPSIFFGSLVKQLKRLWNCKSYLILRDIFPQWTVDNGLMSDKSLIYLYFKLFETINYRSADRIGVMSPANLRFFESSRKDSSKFEVLYNWASSSPFTDKFKTTYRDKYGLQGKVVFFYGGNIGHAQDMMNIVRLSKSLKDDEHAHFLFVGKGDEVELILKAKKDFSLNNLTYLPPVDQKTYYEMLAEFDVGLFSLHAEHKTHNFPGKLLGYMDTGIPILGSVNRGNDLKEIVESTEAGFVSINGDDEKLLTDARRLINDHLIRKKMGKNGKQLLENIFSVKAACSKVINGLN